LNLLNFAGALTGTAVAATIGKGLIEPSAVTQVVVLSALLGATLRNLVTWYFGIPSSSSHALVGALIATVAVFVDDCRAHPHDDVRPWVAGEKAAGPDEAAVARQRQRCYYGNSISDFARTVWARVSNSLASSVRPIRRSNSA
jgi:phosphate transporter family protein